MPTTARSEIAVLGHPACARPVVDRTLTRPPSRRAGSAPAGSGACGRNRAVAGRLAREQLEAAAGVGGGILQQPRAHPVGDPRGQALASGVAALDAVAGDTACRGLAGLARGQQAGMSAGSFWPSPSRVAIQAPRAAGAGAPRRSGRTGSVARPRSREGACAPRAARRGRRGCRRPRRRSRTRAPQRRVDLVDQRDDVVGLVVDGHDDGQLGHGDLAATRAACARGPGATGLRGAGAKGSRSGRRPLPSGPLAPPGLRRA